MLLFRCRFTHNELTAIKNYLPQGEYCLVSGGESREYFGVMEEGLHSRFIDILSGETLSYLEYVDSDEMNDFLRKNDLLEETGNCTLLDEFK